MLDAGHRQAGKATARDDDRLRSRPAHDDDPPGSAFRRDLAVSSDDDPGRRAAEHDPTARAQTQNSMVSCGGGAVRVSAPAELRQVIDSRRVKSTPVTRYSVCVECGGGGREAPVVGVRFVARRDGDQCRLCERPAHELETDREAIRGEPSRYNHGGKATIRG
jgi:hypothetical protein